MGDDRTRPRTMKDVALAAGVGVATVSRALTGNGHISEETRQRVLQAVEDLTYRPSALGRGLKLQRTDTIGLVIADIANDFYSELTDGVLAAAQTVGKHVIVCVTGEDVDTEREYIDLLVEQRVDGIIAVPVGADALAWRAARSLGVRLAFVDRVVEDLDAPAVVANNVAGAREATTHLLGLGHRAIAFLGGPLSTLTGREREAGFRAAHAEAGVAANEDLIVRSRYTADAARESAVALLDVAGDATALFAANNVLGEAAFTLLRDRGVAVPDELSLVMFDDPPWATLITPAMTVVSQPTREMGCRAMELLIDQDGTGSPLIVMGTKLVVRGSTDRRRPHTRQGRGKPRVRTGGR
jgi:LacI family transcriptional regulator